VDDLRLGGDIGWRKVSDQELLPWRSIVESGEEVIEDAPSECGGLLKGDISEACRPDMPFRSPIRQGTS